MELLKNELRQEREIICLMEIDRGNYTPIPKKKYEGLRLDGGKVKSHPIEEVEGE